MDIKIIDTHCHIEQDEFDEDRASVIERASRNGIIIISSAITEETWDKLIIISREYNTVYPSIGLDPICVDKTLSCLEKMDQYRTEIVSIGEVGLDYYRERNHTQRDKQEEVFKNFISLANDLELPIQVHSRSAGKAAIGVLQSSDAVLVQMHAFDGKASLARMASRELGYYFSIPTSVVRSPQKQKLVKAVEIEHLLLETDSPALSAERGFRNEPSNVCIALEAVADILHRDYEEMREITLENSLRLYRRMKR